MLNFLKKLFLSNKYSLLVLLILALWLKLVKDYNILLSYLVLIVLYLFDEKPENRIAIQYTGKMNFNDCP